MTEPSARYLEFQRANTLYELFTASNDVSTTVSSRPASTDDISWWMAFGRYLKRIRTTSSPPVALLYPFLQQLLSETLPATRELFLILKQCIYLYPTELVSLSFQRHLTHALSSTTDPYLNYKYVRLLRLIVDRIDHESLDQILPTSNELVERYHQLDHAVMIVLEHLVLIRSDSALQIKLNSFYPSSFATFLKSNDFDDDELIDLCSILFQVNRQTSLQCCYSIGNILLDLFLYIDYDVETMINWLLTPETGERFLLLFLRLMKYFVANQSQIELQTDDETRQRLLATLKRLHEQLDNASKKSLFPYNIKPLLNVFPRF